MKAAKTLARVAVLLFCPWWLIATSAPYPGGARECFTGIQNPTRLRVVLGPVAPGGSGGSSCNGADGLVPGGSLTLSLSKGPGFMENSDGCYRFDTTAVEGVEDVSPETDRSLGGPAALTIVGGTFFSSTQPGCTGPWQLVLRPEVSPAVGSPSAPTSTVTQVSPLNAGLTERWLVERTIYPNQANRCEGAGRFTIRCEDRFTVDSITELNP